MIFDLIIDGLKFARKFRVIAIQLQKTALHVCLICFNFSQKLTDFVLLLQQLLLIIQLIVDNQVEFLFLQFGEFRLKLIQSESFCFLEQSFESLTDLLEFIGGDFFLGDDGLFEFGQMIRQVLMLFIQILEHTLFLRQNNYELVSLFSE